MIALIQRVKQASVTVKSDCIAKINQGLLVLVAIESGDDSGKAEKMVYKLLNYRIFSDEEEKMNLSVQDIAGQLLLVPQFTLAADTGKGLRPGFSRAAPPKQGLELFTQVIDIMAQQLQLAGAANIEHCLQTGRFGADMEVALVNDGPVTFYLQV